MVIQYMQSDFTASINGVCYQAEIYSRTVMEVLV